jgi:hypothetical protein
MDFSTWVVFSGTHTLDQYLVLAGLGLPMDLTHAIGNFVFILIGGTWLIQTLERVKLRLSFLSANNTGSIRNRSSSSKFNAHRPAERNKY